MNLKKKRENFWDSGEIKGMEFSRLFLYDLTKDL